MYSFSKKKHIFLLKKCVPDVVMCGGFVIIRYYMLCVCVLSASRVPHRAYILCVQRVVFYIYTAVYIQYAFTVYTVESSMCVE